MGSSLEMSEAYQDEQPSKRVNHRACDACRKMKIKCILTGPAPCASCKNSSRPCTFDYTGVKRERPPSKHDLEQLNAKIKVLEYALHKLAPDIDLSSLPRTADQARTMVNLSRSHRTEMDVNCRPKKQVQPRYVFDRVASMEQMMRSMAQLQLPAGSYLDQIESKGGSIPEGWEAIDDPGEPNHANLISNPERPISERSVECLHFRNLADEQYYPAPDLAESLIELYFQKIHPYESTLHQGAFMRHYKTGRAQLDCSFRALCYAIFASASRFSSDFRVAPPTDGALVDRQAAGALYSAAVIPLLTPMTLPCTLFDLQAMSVLSYFLVGACSPMTAWFILGTFLRRAIGEGVHTAGTPRWETSFMKDQLRKRAFWCLFFREVQLSVALGRLSTMRNACVTITNPLIIDDERLTQFCEEHIGKEFGLLQQLALKQQTLFLTTPAFQANHALYNLNQLFGPRFKSLWSLKTVPEDKSMDWDRTCINEIAESMDTHIRCGIPDGARWNPELYNESDLLNVARFQCALSYQQILIHRHLIRTDPKELSVCISAASRIVDILDHLMSRGLLELTAYYTPYLITPAALTFIHACMNGRCSNLSPNEKANAWADVHRCINILDSLAATTFQAEKLRISLNHMVQTCMDEQLFPGSTHFREKPKRDSSTVSSDSMFDTCSKRTFPSPPIGPQPFDPSLQSDQQNHLPDHSVMGPSTMRQFNLPSQLDSWLFQFPGSSCDIWTYDSSTPSLPSYDPTDPIPDSLLSETSFSG
ncbi:hypothetical protein DFH28DRAFT_443936 [Melampsora americana]|nr:hypothetical protein DFH28DRAFT_443936 [Melampsora americana]